MTYSILGLDPVTGEIGAGVQSKFPGAGDLVPSGRGGAGAVASQAFADPRHGPAALDRLEAGERPDAVLAALKAGDDRATARQIAILSADGHAAAHTGVEVLGWRGHAGAAFGEGCVAAGNSLSAPDVVEVMVAAFERTTGELAERLIEALRAGRDAGGEIRGQQSASVKVWSNAGGYGGGGDAKVSIPVYDHPEPIEELARCYRLHRLSYFPSDPDKITEITPQVARELHGFLAQAGFDADPAEERWDAASIAQFKRFMGEENYDNRLRDDARIDLEVLDDLRRRYG